MLAGDWEKIVTSCLHTGEEMESTNEMEESWAGMGWRVDTFKGPPQWIGGELGWGGDTHRDTPDVARIHRMPIQPPQNELSYTT